MLVFINILTFYDYVNLNLEILCCTYLLMSFLHAPHLYDNRFISLPSWSRNSYYFDFLRSVRIWNSMFNDATKAQIFCLFQRLLAVVNVNLFSYFWGIYKKLCKP